MWSDVIKGILGSGIHHYWNLEYYVTINVIIQHDFAWWGSEDNDALNC